MTTLTLHGFAPSTYTRSCRMAAREKGVAHDLQPIEYGQPSHLALHPFGKMPAMTHGDVRLYETLAILDYIDRSFDGPALFPVEPLARARVLAAISAAVDYGYRPVVHTGKDDAGTPDPDNMERAGAFLDWLEGAIGPEGFVAGPALNAADLVLAPMVAYHVGEIGEASLEGRSKVTAWLAAMRKRPSFKETQAG